MPCTRRVGLCFLLSVLFLFSAGVPAQETVVAEPTVESETTIPRVEVLSIDALPTTEQLAVSLSDGSTRNRTLMTMIAVAHLLEYAPPGTASGTADLQVRFRDERAWLDRLSMRYPVLPVRGSELDPAAWFVLHELAQQGMQPGPEISPMGPGTSSLMRQLFDRANERQAAVVLPEILLRMEARSPVLWQNLLDAASKNEVLLEVVSGLYRDWFFSWLTTDPPGKPEREEPRDPADAIGEAAEAIKALAGSLTISGPVDDSRLEQIRFDLLSMIPSMDADQARDAAYLLALASALDGLSENRYLAFTETLLWVVSDLLLMESTGDLAGAADVELPDVTGESGQAATTADVSDIGDSEVEGISPAVVSEGAGTGSALPRLLSDLLPWVSNSFAGGFSAVDPRINASLAAVFDAVQYLQGSVKDAERLDALRRNTSDTIAQLVLLIPDMNYYFDQPVRRSLAEEIDVCISIAANTGSQETSGFSREQFDGCLESLVEMSGVLVTREELSGDSDGPFGTDQLRRELMMPSWQRINFSLGYLHERFPTGCALPEKPLPNPLEWSSLATMVAWFARQAPVYFQTPENEALVLKMRQQGLNLIQQMAQQVDCISGEGTGINDPVRRSLANYRIALNELVEGIREVELDFRAARLKPGADVVLNGDASQHTAYRSQDLVIGPCNPQQICEMTGQLEATRALIGLFPDPYLIADQTGLGSLEICYQNMQWINRREVPVRPDDPHVANFYGHLSFDLVGRYREDGAVTEIFGSNLVSPDEYHYLFAAATDEVREDSCPTEWIGSRIVTTLNGSQSINVVPDRLTYLAGVRKKPSEIIEANWSRGAEWRDWFVTGLGVTPHEYPPDDSIYGRVDQHLRTLYQAEQSLIYAALLRPQSRSMGSDTVESLLDLQEELTARKALVRAYLNLFYPETMIDSDDIRGALEGYDSLLDTSVLRRFREAGVSVASINEAGLARLEKLQSDWGRQPEPVRRSGSVATGLAHAIIRLNTLYQEYFLSPSQKPEMQEQPLPAPLENAAEDQDASNKSDDE